MIWLMYESSSRVMGIPGSDLDLGFVLSEGAQAHNLKSDFGDRLT